MPSQPSPDAAPRVGVVTVSFGSDLVLPGLLDSIPGAVLGPFALVVADNQPHVGASAALAAAAGGTYVPLPDNPGYGAGMNAGVALLPPSVEWVLIANPDVTLGAGSVAALVARGDTDPEIASVGPVVRTAEGEVYPSARSVPSIRTGVGHALFSGIWPSNPWTAAYRNDTETVPTLRDSGWLSGSCQLVRRSAFEELGGFDDTYFMYFEDVDLGFRFRRAGYRNVYEPAAEVTHSGAHSTGRDSARMIVAHHASARRFIERKYPGAILWPVRSVLATGLRIRSMIAVRRLPKSERLPDSRSERTPT